MAYGNQLAYYQAIKDSTQAATAIVRDTNGALTVMEKLSQTNSALADIHAALVQQNILIANILQIIAAKEKLVEGTIAIDAALTQEEKTK